MSKLRLLIADDHWIARSAVGALLKRLAEDVETLEASSADEAMELAEAHDDIDLIVLDLHMPGSDPLSAIQRLRGMHASTPVIVMSVSEERADVLRSLEEGAVGYIPKTATPDTIVSIAERVLNGEVALPQKLLSTKLEPQNSAIKNDANLAMIAAAFEGFTPRQKEVFNLLADGADNTEIAETLGLSINTVRVHLQAVSARLPVRERRQVAYYAACWKHQHSPMKIAS